MSIMGIVSVNTGQTALLGQTPRGTDVYSAIRKAPVVGGTPIYLGPEGLSGDEQTDTRVDRRSQKRIHGGPLKAVYVYPRDHYPRWVREMGVVLVPGDFGENLTLDDVDEGEVMIGERWRWGDAILEVTGPRRPCYKLDLLRGEGTSRAMQDNGRCGWYLSVIEPGIVPTIGEIRLLHRPTEGTSILDAFREKIRRDSTIPGPPED
ncbi:MAG TPA: MOSC domain-containing protein [Candidatus Saccharimonadales bacterium]|nr:MOSC domain-containing protein [Candidatus Saccharimonadales bacterium]